MNETDEFSHMLIHTQYMNEESGQGAFINKDELNYEPWTMNLDQRWSGILAYIDKFLCIDCKETRIKCCCKSVTDYRKTWTMYAKPTVPTSVHGFMGAGWGTTQCRSSDAIRDDTILPSQNRWSHTAHLVTSAKIKLQVTQLELWYRAGPDFLRQCAGGPEGNNISPKSTVLLSMSKSTVCTRIRLLRWRPGMRSYTVCKSWKRVLFTL